ncbi:OmpP1/FadL family transporter [Aequorivita marina]|uniref:OmpP1/FadL family transporter n=1 Tax=Aequorivita marina TaxID=3073654 RepID=UPI0028757DBF|nr:transporter [Aequorivita sp. S2608]MDS1298197.1 transporter [Aequorivita sp. S2608]
MKRISLLIISLLTLANSQAQNITDGLRYSTNSNKGTARFEALSGAMGALGGDFSAIGVNPAGGAVFLNSKLNFSGSLLKLKNESNYFNNSEKSKSDDFTLSQIGGVFVIDNANLDSAFKKFNIGLNYNTTRNYNNSLYIAGTGNTSIGEFFLAQAQGLPLSLLDLQQGESITSLYRYLGENEGAMAQNAFLGYQAFLFDPVDPDDLTGTAYTSNIAGNSFNQEYLYLSQGYNSKFSINFATQVTDKYYFGVNLNTHTINFDQSSFFLEGNSNPGSSVRKVGYENNLKVNGAGISAQLGAIAIVADNIRLGLSFETPTWYQISEETTQYLESRRLVDGRDLYTLVNPNVINVYEDYNLKTPANVTASAAYIFGQSGLISFDYSFKDYSSVKFSTIDNYHDTYFSDLNTQIDNNLKGASTFRAGAEYRLNQLSLRGGFHYEESPYKDTAVAGDRIGFSVGAGYSLGSYSFDLAYSRTEQERNQQLYSVGLTDRANINSIYNNFTLSMGFNF